MDRPASPITPVNPCADPGWDAHVARLPGTGFSHTTAWARVLGETYGFTPAYFRCGDAASPTALLPMIEVDSWLTGRRGVSLPFIDHCAPWYADPAAFNRLFAAVRAHAMERRWRHVEFRGGREFFAHAPAAVAFWGHRIELPAHDGTLLPTFDGAVRRAINKAERSGLTVTISHSLDSLREFYQLLCRTRGRLGAPVQPFAFFAAIHRHVLSAGRGCVVIAHLDAEPVAAAVFLHHGDTALYKFAASDDRRQEFRGNNLVLWRALQWHAANGFRQVDLGRTSLDNEGLRRFKLSWGAHEYRIEYLRYDVQLGEFVSRKDNSSGWHSRVLRRLPQLASRLIGAALYRHAA